MITASEYSRMVDCGAFDHLDRRVELFRGEIREMNPAGPVHNDYIAYLTEWSFQSTSRQSIRILVQLDLDLGDLDSRPEPDLLWVQAGRYLNRHPTAADVRLAIEVSDSSLQADLIEKAELYGQAGIVEYWIIDIQGRCIHVFRAPVQGKYTERSVFKPGELLLPIAECSKALDIEDLFGK